MFTPACICFFTTKYKHILASAACEDYYWEAGFLVHDPSSGLNLAEVQWPEDAAITQSW